MKTTPAVSPHSFTGTLWKQRLLKKLYIQLTGGWCSTRHTEPVGWKYCHFPCIAEMTLLTLMSVTLAIKGFLFFQQKSVLCDTMMIMYDTQVSSIPKFTNIEIQFAIVKFLPQSLRVCHLGQRVCGCLKQKHFIPLLLSFFSTPSNFYNYA